MKAIRWRYTAIAVVGVLLATAWPSARQQQGWEVIDKTDPPGEISIAPRSATLVSAGIVSVWIQHRQRDRPLMAARFEVNCSTQERRLVEVWDYRNLAESAPSAVVPPVWTPTQPDTSMRRMVVSACGSPALRR